MTEREGSATLSELKRPSTAELTLETEMLMTESEWLATLMTAWAKGDGLR